MLRHRHTIMITAVRQAFAASRGVRSPYAAGGIRTVVAALAMLSLGDAGAAGLGEVMVQSALGQPLRATIALLGNEDPGKTVSCFNARLSSLDGALIATPRIALGSSSAGTLITLTTTLPIGEPALALMVELRCGDTIRKEFALLLDPLINAPSVPLVATQRSDPGTGSERRQSGPSTQITPAVVVRPPAQILLSPRPVTPVVANRVKGPTSVLRMSTQETDADLLSSIGLRLTLANRLGTPGAKPGDAGAIPDLAKSAAMRAARARFAAAMRDDTSADGTAPATEEKLQRLQSKLQALETETARLKQASQRDAAVLETLRRDEGGSTWLLTLAGLLLLSAAVIAWLMLRIKRLKQTNAAWNWEDAVPAPGNQDRSTVQTTDTELAKVPTVPTEHDTFAATPVQSDASNKVTAKAGKVSSPAGSTPRVPLGSASYEIPLPAAGTTNATSPAIVPTRPEPDHLEFAELRLQHPAVEEISDVMQEAEFWISLQDAARAIEVLEPYATLEQQNSPLPWIYLFDLYIELGLQEKYEAMREHFHRIFNARVPDWEQHKAMAAAGNSNLRGIEDMPHVSQTICALWQTDQIVPYLESLLIDDREGHRSGFDLSIYQEIMFLIVLAHEVQQMHQPVIPPTGKPGLTLVA